MHIRKMVKLLFVTFLILTMRPPASIAQEGYGERTVFTVGGEAFSEDTILYMLTSILSRYDCAEVALNDWTLEVRRQRVGDITDGMLMAAGAIDAGLLKQPKVILQITRILATAYFDHLEAGWDFSKAAARKYYDAHRADFIRAEAVASAHILTKTESEAIMAVLAAGDGSGWAHAVQAYSISGVIGENATRYYGGLVWNEKGELPREVEEAIMNGQPGQIVGPIQSEHGWHVILVGERRPAKEFTFEEVARYIAGVLEKHYIETELAELSKKYPVKMDDEVLRTLGGVTAPSSAPSE